MSTGITKAGKCRKLMGNHLFAAVFAVVAAFLLNFVIGLSGISDVSGKYAEVSQNQYSVSLGTGIFLYGVAAPLLEETVFRLGFYNIIYKIAILLVKTGGRGKADIENEDEKRDVLFSIPLLAAAILSSLLFGAYHGNIVQFVYGTLMGLMLSIFYGISRKFSIPLIMHSAANIAVFSFTMLG